MSNQLLLFPPGKPKIKSINRRDIRPLGQIQMALKHIDPRDSLDKYSQDFYSSRRYSPTISARRNQYLTPYIRASRQIRDLYDFPQKLISRYNQRQSTSVEKKHSFEYRNIFKQSSGNPMLY